MPLNRKILFALLALLLGTSACGGSSSDGAASSDDGAADAATDAGSDEATPPSNAGSEESDESPDDVDDEIEEEPTDAPSDTAEESVDVFDVGLGDCFNDENLASADEDATEIMDVGAVPCDEDHQFEVYHVFDMLQDEFPGEDETITISEEGCLDAFEPFVGLNYADSIYGLSYLYPTAKSWAGDDREVVCVISMYDGTTKIGTARGTAQ